MNAAMTMNSPTALTGRDGLGFSLPAPRQHSISTLPANPSDIQRYRATKKRHQHDIIPSWMINAAIHAWLGDNLMMGFMGGVVKGIFGHGNGADLTHTAENIMDLFTNAAESVWDMATHDTISQQPGDSLENQLENTMAPTSNQAKPANDMPRNTVENLGQWRQNQQKNMVPENSNYRNTLRFSAP